MTLTINDTTMTSDQNRNNAITAMLLADLTGKGDLHEAHRLWPHIEGWAAELGLTAPDAITRASEPLEKINNQEPAASPADPEVEP